MIIKARFKYVESYLPPRCRKLRYEDKVGEIDIEIPEATKEEAPVAFRHWDYCVPGEIKEIRMYQGTLYSRKTHDAEKWEERDNLISEFDRDYAYPAFTADKREKEDGEKVLIEKAKPYLIIDGEVWMETGEPCYMVCTFGMGNNHGGTSLLIGNLRPGSVNEQTMEFFSALDYDRAVKTAENRKIPGRYGVPSAYL